MNKARPASSHPAAAKERQAARTKATGAYCTVGLVIGTSSTSMLASTCLVTYPENPSHEAQTAHVLSHVPGVLPGQSVLLQFICADLSRPVVLGVLGAQASQDTSAVALSSSIRVEVDGEETLTLMAKKRMVLSCGKARLIMSADGTIEIRGTDILSRSSGQNAIRGASVSLN